MLFCELNSTYSNLDLTSRGTDPGLDGRPPRSPGVVSQRQVMVRPPLFVSYLRTLRGHGKLAATLQRCTCTAEEYQ